MLNQFILTARVERATLFPRRLPDGNYYLQFEAAHNIKRQDGTYKNNKFHCRHYSKNMDHLLAVIDVLMRGVWIVMAGKMMCSKLKVNNFRQDFYLDVEHFDVITETKKVGEKGDEVAGRWAFSNGGRGDGCGESSGAADIKSVDP